MAIKHCTLLYCALFFTTTTHPMSDQSKMNAEQSALKNDASGKSKKENLETSSADPKAVAILSALHTNEIAKKEKTEDNTHKQEKNAATTSKNLTDSPPLHYQGFASEAGTTASLFSEAFEALPAPTSPSKRWSSPSKELFPV